MSVDCQTARTGEIFVCSITHSLIHLLTLIKLNEVAAIESHCFSTLAICVVVRLIFCWNFVLILFFFFLFFFDSIHLSPDNLCSFFLSLTYSLLYLNNVRVCLLVCLCTHTIGVCTKKSNNNRKQTHTISFLGAFLTIFILLNC